MLLTLVVGARCLNGGIAPVSDALPGANAANTDGRAEQARQGLERYASSVEARIRRNWPAFLVLAPDAQARARLRASRILARSARSLGIELPGTMPAGQIQHWVGATFIPDATLAASIPRLEDYDRRKEYMSPEVTESRLLRRQGDHFEVYLRLTERSIISATFDVYLTIQYRRLDETHLVIESRSERIFERPVEETSSAPDRGLLWGLNHYWRIAEMDDGLYLECEALVLAQAAGDGVVDRRSAHFAGCPKDADQYHRSDPPDHRVQGPLTCDSNPCKMRCPQVSKVAFGCHHADPSGGRASEIHAGQQCRFGDHVIGEITKEIA